MLDPFCGDLQKGKEGYLLVSRKGSRAGKGGENINLGAKKKAVAVRLAESTATPIHLLGDNAHCLCMSINLGTQPLQTSSVNIAMQMCALHYVVGAMA